jgi:hypothetical protein
MNEMMTEYLGQLLEFLKSGASLIVEELPFVAKEIISFAIWENIFYVVVPLVLFITTLISSTSIYKNFKKNNPNTTFDDEEGGFWFFVAQAAISAVSGLWFFCATMICLPIVIKAAFAPRLFLIEYISNFVGK